jgi:hypothetical protein
MRGIGQIDLDDYDQLTIDAIDIISAEYQTGKRWDFSVGTLV